MTRLKLVKKHRRKILSIAARRGASNIRLFGSVVRGEDKKVSDIDFLMHFTKGTTIFDRGGLIVELSEMLHCPVDVVSEKTIHPLIREEVLSTAIPL